MSSTNSWNKPEVIEAILALNSLKTGKNNDSSISTKEACALGIAALKSVIGGEPIDYSEDIKNIEICLCKEFGLKTLVSEYGISGENELITVYISVPHEGNDFKWLLRMSTVAAFDRWTTSTAIEEFFMSSAELVDYMVKNKHGIYVKLLKYLSSEYTCLNEDFRF